MRYEPDVLICANSARALAESARAAGYRPVTVDGFADADTRAVAVTYHRVPLTEDGPEADALLAAAATHPALPLVYGSGLDGRPALLRELSAGRPLYGNQPDVLEATANPFAFGDLAQAAGLPVPDSRQAPPPVTGWLRKRAGASGGGHVRIAGAGEDPGGEHAYFQQRLRGRVGSLLFLARNRQSETVGVSEQWCAGTRHQPFRYGGAVSHAPLPAEHRKALETGARRLTRWLGLRGLHALDFITDGPRLWVIELNARPGATYRLYERRGTGELFHAHVAAARGDTAPFRTSQRIRGHEVVYTPTALPIPAEPVWPGWAHDRPMPTSRIAADAPLCTVTATGPDPLTVRRGLRTQRHRLLAWLTAEERGGRIAHA